jgi:hypothetical protein
MMPGLGDDTVGGAIDQVKGRMIPRLKLVGSSAETKDAIEGSFLRQIAITEKHLAARKFLFGGRPALADFGLYAQLYQCSTDPTPGKLIREKAPRTMEWIGRMLDPKADGDFETWERLGPTLMPLVRDEIGAIFFPWSTANAKALEKGEKQFSLTLGGRPYSQEVQKYHARSLAALRARYAAVADHSRLDPILQEAGCLEWLRA